MNRLHIAHILGYLSARYGGPPQVARSIGTALAAQGIDVSYWAAGDQEDRQDAAARGEAAHVYEPRWPRGWFRCPALAGELAARMAEIDVLHLHEIWSYPQYAAARLARRCGKPYVVTPHGIFMQTWRYRTPKKRLYLALVGNAMLRGAACLHAIIPVEIEGFRRAGYRGPVTVIPNGVDPSDYAELPHPGEADERWPVLKGRRTVLFLSRLSREKGLDQLLPAWAELTRAGSCSDALLILAGPDSGGYAKVVQRLIAAYDLESSVLLTGMVRGQDKKKLLSRADIYALPSYSEGFSLSLLENLAAGTPALISPGCNFPEVEAAGAGLCVAPERGALRSGLRRLLELSDHERAAMGKQGRRLVLENYTWDSVARKFATVYACLMQGKQIPLHPEAAAFAPEEKADP